MYLSVSAPTFGIAAIIDVRIKSHCISHWHFNGPCGLHFDPTVNMAAPFIKSVSEHIYNMDTNEAYSSCRSKHITGEQ